MVHPTFSRPHITRRSLLSSALVGSVAALAAPYVKDSYAAGSLALGVWDHWVPGANKAFAALCNEWGTKNNVEVRIDFITSQGEKDKLTAAAEAQAGTGPRGALASYGGSVRVAGSGSRGYLPGLLIWLLGFEGLA